MSARVCAVPAVQEKREESSGIRYPISGIRYPYEVRFSLPASLVFCLVCFGPFPSLASPLLCLS